MNILTCVVMQDFLLPKPNVTIGEIFERGACMRIREATVEDAEGIAKVHVDSWRKPHIKISYRAII